MSSHPKGSTVLMLGGQSPAQPEELQEGSKITYKNKTKEKKKT